MPGEQGDAALADRELLGRAAAGDLEAFATIYRQYQHIVYRFARAMTGSDDAAEDICQEVFVALIVEVTRYDPDRAAFTTYLYGIVRNLSRDRLRRERRRVSLDSLPIGGDSGYVDDPVSRLEDAELAAEVRRALRRLSSRYRELIILCDLHGLSYAEAAIVVRASVGAVRSRLHRGRQLLRLRLTRVAGPTAPAAMSPVRCAI